MESEMKSQPDILSKDPNLIGTNSIGSNHIPPGGMSGAPMFGGQYG